ncbi:MAG: sigma-54 dependent transcriptional regulator [Myxococcota bacterium]
MSRIFVVDDEPSVRFVLREALEEAGHTVEEAGEGSEAREALGRREFDLVFLDLRLPDIGGFELLDEITARGPDAPPVVIITAENTFDNAIEAMKRGAFDYLTKPFDLAEIDAAVTKALRIQGLRSEVSELRRQVGQAFRKGQVMVGRSAEMVGLWKTIGRVAPTDATVLVLGESGTGKELVAQAIHYHSRRSEGPYVAVNMAAIPSELVEAELFGHERGAFTGALEARTGRFRQAHGGTLFLDEVGDLPLPLQAKLLRVLQDGQVTPLGGRQPVPVDVRILAATHEDLEAAVREGRFREDLYFRINVVPIHVPSLRDRRDDIPLLVAHFITRFASELSLPERWPTAGAMQTLVERPWPGNVREVENVVKRALAFASGEVITEEDIRTVTHSVGGSGGNWTDLARGELMRMLDDPGSVPERGAYWGLVEQLERAILQGALERAEGNQLHAARLLGINRNTLRKKLAELDLEPPARRGGVS